MFPGFEAIPVLGHTPQYVPRHWLHASVHLLLLAAAGCLHGALEETVDLLKVHTLHVEEQAVLLCGAQLRPELQEVSLVGLSQPFGQFTDSWVHVEKFHFSNTATQQHKKMKSFTDWT